MLNPTLTPGFLGAAAHRQSYTNIIYLLLGLPLGTAYFVFLVTGLSLGFGLMVTLAGIPVLLLTIGGSWLLCRFERWLAIALLDEDIPVPTAQQAEHGMWPRLKGHLTSRLTWTGMAYLFLRFPIGIGTFTLAVTLVSVSLGLLFAPAYMWTSDPVEWSWLRDESFDPFPWSWVLSILGIPAFFISINIMNATAFLSGRLTRVMLGRLS